MVADTFDEPTTEDAPAAEEAQATAGTRTDGGVSGYRPDRTLKLGVELRRQLARRRTRLVLMGLALLPLLLIGAFALGDDEADTRAPDSFGDLATAGGSNFAVFTLLICTHLLLGLMVALFFGDIVASEASWSSLRYLLAIPVPRARLLRQKACAAAILSGLGLAVLTLSSVTFGSLWYGAEPLRSPEAGVLSPIAAPVMLTAVCGYLAVHLMWVAGTALYLSVVTETPLGAVTGAVALSIFSGILDRIDELGDLRELLPTHHAAAWTDLFAQQPDWTAISHGVLSALIYATLGGIAALITFCRKDLVA